MPTAIPNTLWPAGPSLGNLLRGSNDFGNTDIWPRSLSGGATLTITPNYGIAPDGTQTACRFQATKTTTNYAQIGQTPGHVWKKGKYYTISWWGKNLSDNPVVVKSYTYKGFGTMYTLGGIDPSLTSEWKRYTFTAVATSPYVIDLEDTRYSFNFGLVGLTDSDSCDILIWGFQIVEGQEAGAYVETGPLAIGPEPSGYNVAKTAPSSPAIFSMRPGIPAELEGKQLFTSEISPKFGWNVGAPGSGYWKVGDLLVERTPNNPQLRICTTDGNPSFYPLNTGAWKQLLNPVGFPYEVLDFNSFDELDGWSYQNFSNIAGGFTMPIPTTQMNVQDSNLVRTTTGWILAVHPINQAFANGFVEYVFPFDTVFGPVLRVGTTTQGILFTLSDVGGGSAGIQSWYHSTGNWSSTGQSAAFPIPVYAGDMIRLTFHLQDATNITVYINGIFVRTFTNAVYNTGAGRHGFRHLQPNSNLALHSMRLIPVAGVPLEAP